MPRCFLPKKILSRGEYLNIQTGSSVQENVWNPRSPSVGDTAPSAIATSHFPQSQTSESHTSHVCDGEIRSQVCEEQTSREERVVNNNGRQLYDAKIQRAYPNQIFSRMEPSASKSILQSRSSIDALVSQTVVRPDRISATLSAPQLEVQSLNTKTSVSQTVSIPERVSGTLTVCERDNEKCRFSMSTYNEVLPATSVSKTVVMPEKMSGTSLTVPRREKCQFSMSTHNDSLQFSSLKFQQSSSIYSHNPQPKYHKNRKWGNWKLRQDFSPQFLDSPLGNEDSRSTPDSEVKCQSATPYQTDASSPVNPTVKCRTYVSQGSRIPTIQCRTEDTRPNPTKIVQRRTDASRSSPTVECRTINAPRVSYTRIVQHETADFHPSIVSRVNYRKNECEQSTENQHVAGISATLTSFESSENAFELQQTSTPKFHYRMNEKRSFSRTERQQDSDVVTEFDRPESTFEVPSRVPCHHTLQVIQQDVDNSDRVVQVHIPELPSYSYNDSTVCYTGTLY